MIKDILNLDSNLYKNDKFNKLSDYLLNHIKLVVGDKNYRLVEVELYLYSSNHKDIFTHRDIDQSIKYKFYFHKKGKTYKSGTYKGLDITFGNNTKSYGGALIRSIQDISTNKIIEGPCNVVNCILKIFNHDDISELVTYLLKTNKQNEQDTVNCYKSHKKSKLYLKYSDLNEKDVYSGPRVGLTLKNSNNKLKNEYIMANYRYTTIPNKLKKFKSGLVLNLYANNKAIDDIESITGCKKYIIKRYIDNYNKGKDKSFSDYYNKNLKVNDLCELQCVCNYNNK